MLRLSSQPWARTLIWLVVAAPACSGSDSSDTVDASGQATDSDGSTGGTGTDGASGGGQADGSGAVAVDGLCGWAATDGDGLATTTGGGDAAPVTVTTAEDLIALAADVEPRVIQVDGVFDIPQLVVASNKTIVGLGPDSGINGGIRIRGRSVDELVTNVIVRNLHVNAATTDNEDGIQIQFARHVWVDHVEVFDAPDGNLDVTHGSDFVTVSWTIFHYTDATPEPDHRFSNLIGHTDGNDAEDSGRLNVTFHHDWWADNVRERMPRVRWGQVHVLNNYYSAAGNNYCVGAGFQARVIVESNFFAGVNDPNILQVPNEETGLTAFGNHYEGTTGDENVDLGVTVPPLPANYAACPTDPAENVADLVMAGAGPR